MECHRTWTEPRIPHHRDTMSHKLLTVRTYTTGVQDIAEYASMWRNVSPTVVALCGSDEGSLAQRSMAHLWARVGGRHAT